MPRCAVWYIIFTVHLFKWSEYICCGCSRMIYLHNHHQVSKYWYTSFWIERAKDEFLPNCYLLSRNWILYIMYNSSYLLHVSVLYNHIFIFYIPWLMLWLNPMWNILLNWNVPLRRLTEWECVWEREATRERKQVEFYIVVLTFVYTFRYYLWKKKSFIFSSKFFFYWKNCMGFWVS